MSVYFSTLKISFGFSVSVLSTEKLQGLVAWMPRETMRACCPESFRENNLALL